jgi:hypothetical protein
MGGAAAACGIWGCGCQGSNLPLYCCAESFAWHHVVATMVATGGSYWKLVGATNLAEGDTLGWSGPKYVGLGLYSNAAATNRL